MVGHGFPRSHRRSLVSLFPLSWAKETHWYLFYPDAHLLTKPPPEAVSLVSELYARIYSSSISEIKASLASNYTVLSFIVGGFDSRHSACPRKSRKQLDNSAPLDYQQIGEAFEGLESGDIRSTGNRG